MRRSELLFQTDKKKPTTKFRRLLDLLGIPADNIVEINDIMQVRYIKRADDGRVKERWEEVDDMLFTQMPDPTKAALADCGFVNSTLPKSPKKVYDFWPGALALRAAARLKDNIALWQAGFRWDQNVVFGGKRALQPDKESYEQCLGHLGVDGSEALRDQWDSAPPQTELEMMSFLWDAAGIAKLIPEEMLLLPTTFVDAPMKAPAKPGGPQERPNTEDTVMTWLEVHQPAPGSAFLSSGAPYGMAQDEAFQMLLAKHGFDIETFGHGVPADLKAWVMMGEVARTVFRISRS